MLVCHKYTVIVIITNIGYTIDLHKTLINVYTSNIQHFMTELDMFKNE